MCLLGSFVCGGLSLCCRGICIVYFSFLAFQAHLLFIRCGVFFFRIPIVLCCRRTGGGAGLFVRIGVFFCFIAVHDCPFTKRWEKNVPAFAGYFSLNIIPSWKWVMSYPASALKPNLGATK